jgi:CHAT domain-containing protein/tetratricopeptide (TPR) repeat protein
VRARRVIERLVQEANDLGARGSFGQAIQKGTQALEEARRELPEGDHLVGWVLNSLAVIYHDAGEFLEAEPLYREALEIHRLDQGDEALIALILNSLGSLYVLLGDPLRAVECYDEALEIRRRVLPAEDPQIGDTLTGLARAHGELGDYAAADLLLREALTIQRVSLPAGHPAIADTLNGLGLVMGQLGDLPSAKSLLLEALDITEHALGRNHPGVAGILANLAVLHGHLGMAEQSYSDLEEAERLLREALTIQAGTLGIRNPYIAGTMANLGAACRELSFGPTGFRAQYHQEAERLNREALDIRRSTLGEDHPTVAQTLNNLAVHRHDVGDRRGAEGLLREALELRRRTLGEVHPRVGLTLVNLAGAVAAERPGEALSLLMEAAAIQDQLIGQVFAVGSERHRMAHLEQLQAALAILLSLVLRFLSQDREAVGAALDLVLRRKAIAAEALAAQRDAVLGGRYPHLASVLRELTDLRMRIAQKALAGPGPEGLEEHRGTLRRWEERRESLEADLARAIPEMRLEERLRQADRNAVAAALPPASVLVEFLRFDRFDFTAVAARGEAVWDAPRYVAFILSAGDAAGVRLVDLADAAPIDELIARYRATVAGEGAERGGGEGGTETAFQRTDEPEAGMVLRAAVFDPLVRHLGERTRLFLAPDGDLSRLPFEVLPSDRGDRLIADYEFSYLSTGRDVLRFDTFVGGSAEPLVAAAPDFDLGGTASSPPPGRRSTDLAAARIHFDPLVGTESEGERIGRRLGISPWLRDSVREAPLKASRAPRILHLATHGFFLPDQSPSPTFGPGLESQEFGPFLGAGVENPLLRSGLALAGANTFLAGGSLPPDAEDGILTAEDVSGLDLLGTELVVLSACETGLGEIRLGEGVFGLRRAFVLAGARTLVMSLWKVPDEPSADLMNLFYWNLAKGMGRAEALREAQLKLAAIYPPPWFWGAFVCQGDPGPLASRAGTNGTETREETTGMAPTGIAVVEERKGGPGR